MSTGTFWDLSTTGTINHTNATAESGTVPYKVVEGTYPSDIDGYGFYTAWNAAAGREGDETVLDASFLSSPGRVVRLDLGGGTTTHPLTAVLHTIDNAAWHLRAIAPENFMRDRIAEVSTFGVSNLSNVAPVPFGPVHEGQRLLLGCDPATPTEISPKSLRVHSPVGSRYEWDAFLAGVLLPMTMTTGHPFFDPNDGPAGKAYIAEMLPRAPVRPSSKIGGYPRLRTWAGSGRILGPFQLMENGEPVFLDQSSVHEVWATEDFVLFAESPIAFDLSALLVPALNRIIRLFPTEYRELLREIRSLLFREVTQTPSTRLMIMRKADIEMSEDRGYRTVPCKTLTWPWEASHIMCDYENPGGIITLFAPLSIGFDAVKSVVRGEPLLNNDEVPPRLDSVFGAATDLQVCGKYVIDANSATLMSSKLVPPQDPDDPRFPLGVMLQINTCPLMYRPADDDPTGLSTVNKQWDYTFWCTTGWLPALETRHIFQLYREHRVTEPESHGRPPQRYIAEDKFLNKSRRADNTAMIYRLDRNMDLDMSKDVFRFDPGWLSSTPFWVPRSGAASMLDGYLVSLVSPPTDPDSTSMQIWIWDAGADLANGPVCKLAADQSEPFRVGYPLHSVWMDRDAVDKWQPPSYRQPMVEVHWPVEALDVGYIGMSYVYSILRSRLVDLFH